MWFWGILAWTSLLWPSRVAGLFDGMPLDGRLEAIAAGVVFPVLWWLYPRFLALPHARICIVGLVIAKAAAAAMAPGGWCLAFDPPRPMVRDSTGKPHAWDVRADWRAPDPQCSAVMTRSFREPRDFPAWFFNLAPPDDAPSANGYQPGQIDVGLTAWGFIDVTSEGEFELLSDHLMNTVLTVDGSPVAADAPGSHSVKLGRGRHLIQIDGVLAGKGWRLVPSWNGAPLGARGFPHATMRPVTRTGRLARLVVNAAIAVLASALLVFWLRAWAASLASPLLAGWVAMTIAIVTIAAAEAPVMAAWFAVAAMAGALVLQLPPSLANLRGAFLVAGVPWLAFVVAANAEHIGRWTSYFVGVDNWTFQRYAYRIYLQGYWLEGGQTTFWFQPLYRWIAGALHLVFGDSSVGQAYWDAACAFFAALFAAHVTHAIAGFRWGAAAAVLTLAMMLLGPNREWVGFGLSEISSSGFLYLAALFAIRGRTGRSSAILAAGLFATLAFYTRLNNLPMAVAVGAFALPLQIPASAVFSSVPWRTVSWKTMIGVLVTLGVGLVLFAWRTWYYTGVFSVLHGTQSGALAVWQPGMTVVEGARAMSASLLMVLTASDPPRFALHSLPLLASAVACVGSLMGVKRLRTLPLPLVVFFLAGCVSPLVARGWAFEGRFSVHLLGIASAITLVACAALLQPVASAQALVAAGPKRLPTTQN